MAATYPSYPERTANLLDGIWDFCWLGEVDPDSVKPEECVFDRRMAVPGCFDTLPVLAGKRGCAALRTRVYCPPGQRGLVHCKGMGLYGVVWMENECLGQYTLPYSAVSFEVPPDESAARDLVIVLDNRVDPRRTPLLNPDFDFYLYGGIYRSVEWHVLPETAIRRALIHSTDLEEGMVHVKLILHQPVKARETVHVRINRGNWCQAGVLLEGDDEYCFDMKVDPERVWSPESPMLQSMQISVGGDSIVERFGHRTVSIKEGKLHLNGKKLTLKGFCRHESHPDFGPALPDQLLLQDIERICASGANFVRGSHYPQDQRFLDCCDERGLLVMEESLASGAEEDALTSEEFIRDQVLQTRTMVETSYNHPSVLLWGILNEADGASEKCDRVFKELVKTVKENDPSRLLTYASKYPFTDHQFPCLDVISINTFPGWNTGAPDRPRPLEEIDQMLEEIYSHFKGEKLLDKPVLISALGAEALFGWRDAHHAHWSEEYQRDYLIEAIRCLSTKPWICGYALNQLCDTRSHDHAQAVTRPRTYNNFGVCDEFRRPKLAWEAVCRAWDSEKTEDAETLI